MVNLALMLILITSYKGMVDAECTKYSKREGVRPAQTYQIAFKKLDSATECQNWCNEDAMCRSAVLGRGFCVKDNISVQELQDTGREDEVIKIDTDQHGDSMETTTYDRHCDCPAGQEMSSSSEKVSCKPCKNDFFKASAGSEKCTKCVGVLSQNKTSCAEPSGPECTDTYPVTYYRMSPDNDRYRLAYMRDYKNTAETCQKWCNDDERCRSVRYSERRSRTRVNECVKYNISVSELKDRDFEIYHEISRRVPVYITYERDCGGLAGYKCTNVYPVSHDSFSPDNVKYSIVSFRGGRRTSAKTCQKWCNRNLNCKSVLHWISRRAGGCKLYRISLQKLKQLGKNDDIKTLKYPTYITYDRFCGSDKLSTLNGTVTCLPMGNVDKATCHALPSCFFIELEILGAPISMCVRHIGVLEAGK